MSRRFAVRFRDEPAALERILGLLRRRRATVLDASLSEPDRGTRELVVRLAADVALERARLDLESLADVMSVQSIDGEALAVATDDTEEKEN